MSDNPASLAINLANAMSRSPWLTEKQKAQSGVGLGHFRFGCFDLLSADESTNCEDRPDRLLFFTGLILFCEDRCGRH
jgi:hypothetical protein